MRITTSKKEKQSGETVRRTPPCSSALTKKPWHHCQGLRGVGRNRTGDTRIFSPFPDQVGIPHQEKKQCGGTERSHSALFLRTNEKALA